LVNNPVKSVKKLKKVKKPIRFLNENEIQLFLEIAKEKVAFKYYALFYTAIFTGMRRGELLGLEWSDVDFYHKKININKQIYKGILTSTKTESGTRIIDMSDGLIEVLKEHRRRLKVVYNPVFAMDNGRHIHAYNMVNRYYKPVLRELSERLEYENNVDSLTFHGLRHTYASMLLSNNVPVKYVQEQLGHASSKITLDTYNHVMPSIKDRAMEIMNKIATSEDCITEKNVSGTVD
jgi:integrase